MTLYDAVRYCWTRDAWKHELSDDPEQYATDHIDQMTPNELLKAISEELEERGIVL